MKKYLHVISIGLQSNLAYRVNYLTRTLFSSTPEAEFQETVNKSMSMRKAVALAENFAKAEQPA